MRPTDFLPIFGWLKTYSRSDLQGDAFASAITAILLVPQGIAYALLAGIPPQLGLYASILPPMLYALFGTSRTLSVGPVSIAAVMIASALASPEISALHQPEQSAVMLAAETGMILLLMALLRMGSLVNFISHPVLTGFTSGASILIVFSQLPPLLGLAKFDCTWSLGCYADTVRTANPAAAATGFCALSLLILFGRPLTGLLKKTAMKPAWITAVSKCGPLLAVALGAAAVNRFDLHTDYRVATVGPIPAGLPALRFDMGDYAHWRLLLPYAVLIALVAYVESVAIAKAIANLKGEKIRPNQELFGLGAANIASALSGGMAVAGGFSRTMVNFSAGARTQLAMLAASGLVALALMFFSPYFAAIPKSVLAAIILVAITPLIRLKNIVDTWRYDASDGLAEGVTLLGVLVLGIEEGITLGIVLTLISYLRITSHPHIAVVGRIQGTEHFRNVKRHEVKTWRHLLLLRVDENLTFANVNYVEEFITDQLRRQPDIRHIVLIFASVSYIDSTALEVIEGLNDTLKNRNITLHLSEAKGPVLDKLQKTDFLGHLKPGKVFFRTQDAVNELA
ncbi:MULTISPECIES: SulP family inorganic anion transporter [Methylomicrobium]|uniref:Sulfate permease-like transporter, MFS superfamily n=1 Tax=Methylomicrobium album BG8 TaxID=686340 RepID=H8GM54_METAL|nr:MULTISPECIES: SulP family inorganic anion transporter [Methylomicrobium]EIC29415.1 sulfate permease-like transporter, MFS superfamily [Methylomicrobium album BG8]